MSFSTCASSGQAASASPVLDHVFSGYSGAPFAIRFWDGTSWYSSPHTVAFAICLNTEDAWDVLCTAPTDLALGGRYVEGEIDVEGDMYLALRTLPLIKSSLGDNIPISPLSLREYTSLLTDHVSRFLHGGTLHSQKRDAASISRHYDKPPEFYELFLGPSMVYSCAYFRSWINTLECAQFDKMDLICRKLDLQPNERFLDIGCGWGSLVLHARDRYGVSSHGVSLSEEQVKYAKCLIEKSGHTDNCLVQWSDFRDLDEVHMPFNKIASVGMCEHVGRKQIDAYFREAYKLLLPKGLFLNHGITTRSGRERRGPSFIDRYVFPDGELLTLTEMIRSAEEAGFEVRDVEDLREHYEETLHRWVDALVEHEERVVAITDEKTFRIWKLYMIGSAEAFRRGDIAVHQLLLSRNENGQSSAAKVRELWYQDERFG